MQSWQLHANDQIQLQLEDWFKEEGIPYQRQHRAFAKMSAEEWQQKGYTETRAIELIRLARTYLAVEGELTKLSHIAEEFESETSYAKLFGPHRLEFDIRKVILCYKVGFKINALVREIKNRGEKYDFVSKGRDLIYGLVCQGMLNDENIEDFLPTNMGIIFQPLPTSSRTHCAVTHQQKSDFCFAICEMITNLLTKLLKKNTAF